MAPALALLGLAGMGYFGRQANNRQQLLLEDVVNGDMVRAQILSLSAQDIQAINGGIYRLFTVRAASTANVDSTVAITALVTRIDAVRSRLSTIQPPPRLGAWQPKIASLRRDLAAYRVDIVRAGAILNTDYASAVASVAPLDITARQEAVALSQMADDAVHAAQRKAIDSEREAASLRIVFQGSLLAILVAVSLCAWEMTRRTVEAVRAIAHATLLVARGEQSLDVNSLVRGDELGTIVESLRSFQSNNERVAFLAHHDALTTLPNRTLLHDRMVLALLDVSRGRHCAIHCLDLDHFKAVNDTLGHPVGDGLLQTVSARLKSCVREGDTVARLGGDEFAIVQRNIESPQAAAELAQRVIDMVSQPYEINGHQIIIGTSVGVAMTPCDGQSVDVLLRNGDMALYRAKTEGRSTWRVFEPDMDAALQQRRILELDMRAALAGQQFELYYQPLVNVRSHEVSGFEALIRWHHPERGVISPAEFIPLAEETGLIVQIGAWVLRQACADAAEWKSNLKVAVNLSPLQFKDRNLVAVVQQALSLSGLPAWRLDLEITEGVLLQESESTLATLHKLRSLGIRISMDDFGTGYSSLSYLRSFPFDKIKIDQSFIRDLAGHTGSAAIVRAVTGLGSSLGIHTTAEGVETEEQLARLIAEGCTEVQGYLFSPPRPAREVPKLVEEISRRRASSLVAVVIDAKAEQGANIQG